MDVPAVVVIVAAHNEADRIEQTLAALNDVFPGARILVADDASTDDTAARAAAAGAEVVTAPRNIGKGGANTLAARRVLSLALTHAPRNIGKGGANTLAARRVLSLALTPDPPVFVLCDGDLGDTARQLPALVAAVRRGECDLAVAAFSKRVGGGFGVAVGYARAAIRRLTGLELDAPISGQRAMRGAVLPVVVPFAHRFGMEIGMTVDAARAGFRVGEIELDLAHRATGKDWRGFVHRARQLKDFAFTELSRR